MTFAVASKPTPGHRRPRVLQRSCACGGTCPRCQKPQTKRIVVGPPNDSYEREADRVADQVMRMPEGSARARPAVRDSSGGVAMSAGGRPLPESVRAYFEPRFGHDFGHVRIHTDARASAPEKRLCQMTNSQSQNLAFVTFCCLGTQIVCLIVSNNTA